MRRLIPFICLSVIICSCADQGEPDPQCPEQKECKQCDKTECPAQTECPTLECDGNKCPTCPTCDQKECPPAQCDGKECPVCDTCEKCEECDTSKLDSEIDKLKGDLQAQVEATESCAGDLDTCSKDLATNKLRNIKSGTRLKLYNYVSEDGAQWPTLTVFDSKKNVNCTIKDFSAWSEFGCTDQLYCVNSSKYQSIKDYIDPSLYSSASYPSYTTLSDYCRGAYSKSDHDNTILNNFGKKIISGSSIAHYEGQYYIDDTCTTLLSNPFIRDTSCSYDMNTIFSEYKAVSTNEHETQVTCIDNSTINYTYKTTEYKYFYYKPKAPEFTDILYQKSGTCTGNVSYKKAILLEEIPNLDTEIAEARVNRQKFCQQLCAAINKEAVEEDWVKINLVPAE